MAAGCGSESGLTGLLERETPAHAGLPKILAAIGDLEVRLATTDARYFRRRELRYRVFFEEGAAAPIRPRAPRAAIICRFDRVCDHLIVVDNSTRAGEGPPAVVGAYRLLRQEVAERAFRLLQRGPNSRSPSSIARRHPDERFLELGRSCVAKGYRSKRTLELLWRGIWAYALHHRIDVMFGCASFAGAFARRALGRASFLASANPALLPLGMSRAAPGRACAEPRRLSAPRRARRVRACRRSSRATGASAPISAATWWSMKGFGTTDVLVVLPVAEIRERYLAHFAPQPPPADLAA